VKKKMQLMDALCDIEIASSIMNESKDEDDPVEKNYKALKADIKPLDKDGELYKLLEGYALNTHDKSVGNFWEISLNFG
jgi:hypothetical protein